MKYFKIIILLFILSNSLSAQSLKKDTLFIPAGLRQYQFQLEKPVKAIEHLQYEKSGEPIKGYLSPDGSRIIMDNYKKGQRVKVDLIQLDGIVVPLIKSSCFIDPINYTL